MDDKKLAVNGGPKAITKNPEDIFTWPIVTEEDEKAVLEVLRAGKMSGLDITLQFEKEFAKWLGTKYALSFPNGTAALRTAMWAIGIGAGDEIICPSITYWASCTQALTLGAAVNFSDIKPETLCIDPDDIEHRIGPRTKAIVVVHYSAHPAEMDAIMKIARKHNVKVIEDVSHAQGGLYKSKKTGTFGDVAGISMMSGKSFAIGEGGMIATNNKHIIERAVAYGHYIRTGQQTEWHDGQISWVDNPELKKYKGVPLGGYKSRLNQTCSAMGRVQLKYYDERIKEIDKAMNYFCDGIDKIPGLKAIRPPKNSGSTMAGWYNAKLLYAPEEFGGTTSDEFAEAVVAEGVNCKAGTNFPLHLHPVFHTADIFNMGKPTMVSFGQRDVRQGKGNLPVSEGIHNRTLGYPCFRKYRPEIIDEYIQAFRKVAAAYRKKGQ
jgi:perosamine synthetase